MGLLGESARLEGEGSTADHDGFTYEHGCALRRSLRATETPGAGRLFFLDSWARAAERARAHEAKMKTLAVRSVKGAGHPRRCDDLRRLISRASSAILPGRNARSYAARSYTQEPGGQKPARLLGLGHHGAARAAPPQKTRFFGVPTPRGHAFGVQF